jgi:RNA polymerase primary sigma factor
MRRYKSEDMKRLAEQQVRYAPVDRCLEQLNRAERFLTEIQPGKRYPYEYVEFRITGFRPGSAPQTVLEAADLEHDMVLLINDLSRKVPAVPIEEVPEPVLTLDELRRDLKVSTKTISRWRDRGLVSRRVICNGKRRLGVRQSLLKRFLRLNEQRVERGARFRQLSEDERAAILLRAKRLARVAPDSFTEICRRIARKTGRSFETVRYTIHNHDRQNPGEAIFPGWSGPLSQKDKQAIYMSHRRGISIHALAKRFNRKPSSMHRVVNEMRAHQLQLLPLDYIDHPSFHDPAMEAEIMAPMPGREEYEVARQRRYFPGNRRPICSGK